MGDKERVDVEGHYYKGEGTAQRGHGRMQWLLPIQHLHHLKRWDKRGTLMESSRSRRVARTDR